ncbi:hypothetical protein F2Q68_00030142 [Brassica cretica]|uniref:Uncharacterized protein n=1 Tax=Brassica cretica TaxID=69181 RepID=A0A8S9GFP4_BRACR|nr:hypothetical protein F2Q68_00030142 [Brassica cretica]
MPLLMSFSSGYGLEDDSACERNGCPNSEECTISQIRFEIDGIYSLGLYVGDEGPKGTEIVQLFVSMDTRVMQMKETPQILISLNILRLAPQVYSEADTLRNLKSRLAKGLIIKCTKCNLKGDAFVCYIRYWNPSVTHVLASKDVKGACTRTVNVIMDILNGKGIINAY